MDALLFAFVAAALTGVGDQSQVLAATLADRTGRPARVLAGLAVAAATMATVAFVAGSFLHELVSARAQTQLVALALVFAGATGLMKSSAPRWMERFGWGAFLGALILGFFAASSGRLELVTLAFASRAEIPLLAAIGGALGMIAAATPAALLGDKFLALDLRPARIVVGAALLIAGALVFLNAPPPTV